MAKINAAIEFNKPIDGHIPGISGDDLKQYVSAVGLLPTTNALQSKKLLRKLI